VKGMKLTSFRAIFHSYRNVFHDDHLHICLHSKASFIVIIIYFMMIMSALNINSILNEVVFPPTWIQDLYLCHHSNECLFYACR
jgi:hypothetical protein